MSAVLEEKPLLKLNLGCGKSKMDGYVNVDSIKFDNVDQVADLKKKWPWADNSVEHIHLSHVLEHFDGQERVHIFNEMHRVLVNGGKALIITPHWASQRAYGDFTHKWPPVCEFLYYYLSKEWRRVNAPHNDIEFNPKGYKCDFSVTGGYSLHPQVVPWNLERQTFAQTFYKEACQDTMMTAVAIK
jgi:ubiquinone/menaquinone biosynthesis C-methylase UbiE